MREIIVKIPDTAYEGILNADKVNGNWGKDLLGILCNAIVNAAPLLKGQGVLKAEKIAMLEELKMEIEEEKTDTKHLHYDDLENAESYNNGIDNSIDVIQTRIDKLKEDKE